MVCAENCRSARADIHKSINERGRIFDGRWLAVSNHKRDERVASEHKMADSELGCGQNTKTYANIHEISSHGLYCPCNG